MCKCTQRNCNLEVFENSNKCILHCEKDDWYKKIDEKSQAYMEIKRLNLLINKDWSFSNDKIDFFWNELNNTIEKSTLEKSLKCNLNSVIFPSMGYGNYPKVAIYKIKILSFRNCIFLDTIDLSSFFDANSLEITKCTFHEDIIIKNVIHKDQFIFQNNDVLKNIKFFYLEFNGPCIFILNKFKKELTFDGVRFNEYAVFNNSEIEDLFFRNTFFRKESNFLDMKLSKVGSRETARIIKDSFEQQNNIIEANKFYALEMKEREKELERDLKEGKNIFEWLVFKVHGLSSNHSQNWLLALFWIVIFTLNYSFLNCISKNNENHLIFFSLISMIVLYVIADFLNDYIDDKFLHFTIMIIFSFIYYLAYGFTSKDFYLKTFSNNLNPFSIMTELSKLDFSTMIYKITIAYLIYQLIISIRQNTRRK
jgi:hypothetical protein